MFRNSRYRACRFLALCVVVAFLFSSRPLSADYTVTGNETYDSATMTGTIAINEGATLSSTDYIENVLEGTGTWNFTGNGDYDRSGKTNLNNFSGTIQLSGNMRWRGRPLANISENATFNISGGAQVWITGNETVKTDFIISGRGEYDNRGAIRFDGNGSTITGDINIVDSSQISVRWDNKVSSATISGVISGGTLIRNDNDHVGLGTLILTGTNTYGGTTIEEGVLQIGAGGTSGTLGTGEVVINTGLRSNGAVVFNRSDAIEASNTFSGNGRLAQSGTGTLTLSGGLTGFTGTLEVNSGTLGFGGDVSLGGSLVAAGGTLNLDNLTSAGSFTYLGETTLTATEGHTVSVGASNINTTVDLTTVDTIEKYFETTDGSKVVLQANGVVDVGSTAISTALLDRFAFNGGRVQATGDWIITDAVTNLVGGLSVDGNIWLNTAGGAAEINVSDGMTLSATAFGDYAGATTQNFVKSGAGTMSVGTLQSGGTVTVQAGVFEFNADNGGTSRVFTINEGGTLQMTLGSDNTGTTVDVSGDGVWHIHKTSGTVQNLANSGNFSGTIKLTGNHRFQIQGYNTKFPGVTFDVSDGAQFWLRDTGNLNLDFKLSGTNNTFSDNRGVLRFDPVNSSDTNMAVITGSVELTGDARISTIYGDNPAQGMISGVISGAHSLEKNESHTIASNPRNAKLILTGDNTYSGGTQISTGTLQVGFGAATGTTLYGVTYYGTSGSLGTGAVTVDGVAALRYCRTDEYTVANAFTVKSGGLFEIASGTMVAGSGFSLDGAMTIAGGAKFSAENAALTGTSSIEIQSGGTLATTRNKSWAITGEGTWEITAGNSTDVSVSNLNLSGFDGTLHFVSGRTVYTRPTAFGNATVQISNGASLMLYDGTNDALARGNYANNFILSGTGHHENRGALRFHTGVVADGDNTSMGAITGNVQIVGETRIAARIGDSPTTGLIAGVISGDENSILDKNDAVTINGVLILTGDNTYAGQTRVSTGTLQLGYTGKINDIEYDGTTGTLGTGNLSVLADGTLLYNRSNEYTFGADITNAGTINVASGTFGIGKGIANTGTLEVAEGAKLAIGTDTLAASLDMDGTYIQNGGLSFDIFSNTEHDFIDLLGSNTTFGEDAFFEFVFHEPDDLTDALITVATGVDWSGALNVQIEGALGWSAYLSNGNLILRSAAAVPEPSSWFLMGLASALVFFAGRRHVRRRA
ncbi:MAG: autotransporter-associated beta strand repeat-containing protein [Planctomycetia bacterium]|nr:autotransporter-associated beta strand repeat-containing protein [Planctomycetia bacterium]